MDRAEILLDRLERISADSSWAHQASGIRASIAKAIIDPNTDLSILAQMLELGFDILGKVAAEIPDNPK